MFIDQLTPVTPKPQPRDIVVTDDFCRMCDGTDRDCFACNGTNNRVVRIR